MLNFDSTSNTCCSGVTSVYIFLGPPVFIDIRMHNFESIYFKLFKRTKRGPIIGSTLATTTNNKSAGKSIF